MLQQTARVHFHHSRVLQWRQGDHLLEINLDLLPAETEIWLAQAPENVMNLEELGDMLVLRAWGDHVVFDVYLRYHAMADEASDSVQIPKAVSP